MKSIDLLVDDHRYIQQASNVLEQLAGCVERGEAIHHADLTDVVRFLADFGDRHHQEVEEGVLFPALLRDPKQKNYHRISGLIFEHDRQRSLIVGLQESLFTDNRGDFVYCARRLNEILRAHIKEENEVLFPLVESTFSPADDQQVTREIENYDRAWRHRELAAQLQRLAAMESKYVTARVTTVQRPG